MDASIVVPARNEAGNAEKFVRILALTLLFWLSKGWKGMLELIVVDDSDNRDTVEAFEAWGRRFGRPGELEVRTIHRERHQRPRKEEALATAVVEGIRASKFDVVLIADCDLQHWPGLFLVVLAHLLDETVDVVVPTRWRLGGSAPGLTSSRKVVSRVCGLVARLLFPRLLRGVSDPTGGFAAFRKNKIDLDALNPKSWKILIEMLVRSGVRNKLNIVEYGYEFGSREAGSSHASLQQGLVYFKHLAWLRLSIWLGAPRRLATPLLGLPGLRLLKKDWAQFLVTGGSGVIVQIVAAKFLLDTAHMSVARSTILAIGVGIAWNYLFNRRTFRNDERDRTRHLKFWSVRMATAYLQFAMVVSLPQHIFADTHAYLPLTERFWYWGIWVVSILLGTVINYVACRFWVFESGLKPVALMALAAEGRVISVPLALMASVTLAPVRIVGGRRSRRPSANHPKPSRPPRRRAVGQPKPQPRGRHRAPASSRPARRKPGNPGRTLPADPQQAQSPVGGSSPNGRKPQAEPSKLFHRFGEPIPKVKIRRVHHLPRWARRIGKTGMVLAVALGIAYAFYNNAHYAKTEVVAGIAILLGLVSFRTNARLGYRWSSVARARAATKPIEYAKVQKTAIDIIVASRHETVLADNLKNILRMARRYPANLVHVYLAIHEDDPDTQAQTHDVLRDASDIFHLVLVDGEVKSKPIALNQVLGRIKGHYVCPLDSETIPAEELLLAVDAILQENPDVAILQLPVYLMNNRADRKWGIRWGTWWRMQMVLEYRTWFLSVMSWMAAHGFLLLGGNTIFIRSDLLQLVGGWPLGLTEDAWLGIRLSRILKQLGLRIMTVHQDKYASREQTPQSLWKWLFQRMRWQQGHIEVKLSGEWRELPTFRQRILAWESLSMPAFQALAGLILPVSLLTLFLIKVPVPAVVGACIPAAYTVIYSVSVSWIYWRFCRAFKLKVNPWYVLVLMITTPVYQMCLSIAATGAIIRNIRGKTNWVITGKDKDKVTIQSAGKEGDHELAQIGS